MITKKNFKLFITVFAVAFLCLTSMSAFSTVFAASSVYVDDIANVSKSELTKIIKNKIDLPLVYYETRINGGEYEKKGIDSQDRFAFTDGVEYSVQIKNAIFKWETRGSLVFHQKNNVNFSMKDNQSIFYYDGMPDAKAVIFNAVCNGASCTPSLSATDVTIYFMCDGNWVDITSKSASRIFGSEESETVALTHVRDSENWDDIYKTSISSSVTLNIKDPRVATHIEMKSEIPPIRIGSDYTQELAKYIYVARDDKSEVDGAELKVTVNNGVGFEAEGVYPVKIEYSGENGKYFPAFLGTDGLFYVSFYDARQNYTAKLDCVGSGTVTINRNGSDEAFSSDKIMLFTSKKSNGFTINATPANKSGCYTYSIVVKNGSRIVAESKTQNSLVVPEGLFEDGDICTVFVTFKEAEIHFSKYISLHNKTKVSDGASKSACKQAIFDEAYIAAKPFDLTVNDVTMKMERDVFGFVDFDYGLNHFGTRDKETVKIYYTYNGVSMNNVVYVSFYVNESEIVVPDGTILLNEGDNYAEELNKKLSVKIKGGNPVEGAALSFTGLDENKLNLEQKVTASYAGIKGDISSSSAEVNVKIIPKKYFDAKEAKFGDSGNTININVVNYLDSCDKDVILATYKADGRICDTRFIGKTTFNYSTTALSFDIESKDFENCKLFIWDSIDSMHPFLVKDFQVSDIIQ